MRALVTGANGFIGRNLVVRLRERADIEVSTWTKADAPSSLGARVAAADFVFHLAGVNRPVDDSEFATGNADLTRVLCDAVRAQHRPIPIVYSSSIQSDLVNPYGRSKRAAEDALKSLAADGDHPAYIYRLPNVFGKWSRPNYNSVIATFCHNIARGLPIQIRDPSAMLDLVYVDDVVDDFLRILREPRTQVFQQVAVQYRSSLGELAAQLLEFEASRTSLVTPPVGVGLMRALYATYISFFPTEHFSYGLTKHEDARGIFVEMLKTKDSGQFSYFTAHPGVTRGGHYHHSKTEKFLVVRGEASFRFRHLVTGEFFEQRTSHLRPEVVETIPGWVHDITNVGPDEMIVMLWANEIFDRQRPDTIASGMNE